MKPAWAIDEYPSRRTTLVCCIATKLPTVIDKIAASQSAGPHRLDTCGKAR